MQKIELVSEKEFNISDENIVKCTTYKSRFYTIQHLVHSDSDKRSEVVVKRNRNNGDFIQEIFIEDKLFSDSGTSTIKIGTSSFGSLSEDEVLRLIDSYKEALDTVKWIKNKFNDLF